MFAVFLVCFCLGVTDAVIYRLNDSQYDMMPPVVHLDPYEACDNDENALYCTTEFVLVSDQPNFLLDMIKEYSEHDVSHFNHTKLRYGICINQICKKIYVQENGDLKTTLEACLNETFSKKYNLKVKMLDEYHCKPPKQFSMHIDGLDIIVGAVCLLILVINVAASLCDLLLAKRENEISIVQNKAFRLLLCFSLQRNWNKLVMPFGKDNPRIQRLQGLHGIRVITMCLMIACHAFLPCVVFMENPKFMTEFYSVKPLYIFLNGTLIMQTFLMTSSFLLVYQWLLQTGKKHDSWYSLPKTVILRWLRLTPPYALVLALTATWSPRLATGPAWHKFVAVEMHDCRQYWWQNILYINNYFSNSKCMLQCWYLATDMQLYILAVVIYLACRTTRARKIVLLSLFFVGMLIPAAYVYFQDLDGIQMITPEGALSQFFSHPHFNYVYKRSHTNIVGCIVGVAMGYLVYYWQQNGVRIENYQTVSHRVIYWSLFPLAALCCYSGCIFFYETPRPSVYVRTAYAAFLKPAFSLFIGGTIIGCIFKIEDLYRSVLEWPGWTSLSRLSYCAYLLHVMIIKTYTASITQTFQVSYVILVTICSSLLIVTFVIAVFLWLLVEAPLTNVIRECLSKLESVEEKKTK